MAVANVLPGSRLDRNIDLVSPASHEVIVERLSEGKLVSIPTGHEVQPGEKIRVSVHGLGRLLDFAKTEVSFVHGITGTVGKKKSVRGNAAGNAWWDTTAPSTPGPTTIMATAKHGFPFKRNHGSIAVINVSGNAPAPPRPVEGSRGGFVGRIISIATSPFRWAGRTAKSLLTKLLITLLIGGVIVTVALVVASKVLKTASPMALAAKLIR
tara:strand:+ start:503 stop:1135 length:633 start_codon:yes stop_codon:yes gene_type:complete